MEKPLKCSRHDFTDISDDTKLLNNIKPLNKINYLIINI